MAFAAGAFEALDPPLFFIDLGLQNAWIGVQGSQGSCKLSGNMQVKGLSTDNPVVHHHVLLCDVRVHLEQFVIQVPLHSQ